MKATAIEFKLRGLWIGLIFWMGFALYTVDHVNLGQVIIEFVVRLTNASGLLVAHCLFALAAVLAALAALLRTWATSYLSKEVVHNSQMYSDVVVADGPYRYTRNPLYLGTDLLALSMAPMASRLGAAVIVLGIVVFNYRLILREEAGLEAEQGEGYRSLVRSVPRLIPALSPRLPAGGKRADWKSGFLGESYFWAFALGEICFAISLKMSVLAASIAISIALLMIASWQASRKKRPASA